MSIIEVSSKAHFTELVNGDTPICVMFTAVWCGPCKTIYPEIRRLASAFGSELKFVTVDADDHPEICQVCRVRMFPTFLFVFKGKQLDYAVGADVNNVKAKARDVLRQLEVNAKSVPPVEE